MAPRIPRFLAYEVGDDGRVRNFHQSTVLRFHGTRALVWRGELSVPAFWATLFSRDELTASGATTDLATALERLTRRRDAWRRKASPLVFRGFPRFVDWVASVGSSEVELDVTGLDPWRQAPLMGAVEQLIAFLDDASEDPGPLPFGADDVVQWVKGKRGMKLQSRVADLRWPDEAPLFGPRTGELTDHTVGVPPFRQGPWPERRLVEDPGTIRDLALDTAIKERSRLVRAALASCPNGIKLAGAMGNLEAIARMRAHYRERCSAFREAAGQLMESAPAFAKAYQVFDDAGLWQEMLATCGRWEAEMEAWLAEEETAVASAMKAAREVPPGSGNELDLDDFPSGDDPF